MTGASESDERTTDPAGERPRIGFVVDWLKDSYQLEVLEGAMAEARKLGVQLVVLPGGVLGAEHDHGSCRNPLYSLIEPSHFDGLVVMTGTLGNALEADIMSQVCPSFPKDRVCHVAVDVAGSPSVLIDNVRGVRKMVEHLLWVHRCKHIAFIRGPGSNPEAQTRYVAYREALDASGIVFDERLVLDGDFQRIAGVQALQTLFDERGVSIDEVDAIVSSDDTMALAAIGELRRRGIRVPGQIAVTGFDDVEEARYASPPLSTVHQPLLEQGRVAVRTLLDPARAIDRPIVLDTVDRFRRSCGCTAEDPGFLTIRPKVESRLSLEASVQRRHPLIVAELARSGEGLFSDFDDHWEETLFQAVLDTLRGREEAFRESFDVLLERILERGIDPSIGHTLISALRRHLSVCSGDDPAQIRQAEGLLHDARILTSNAVGRAEASRRLQVEEELHVAVDVAARLASATEASLASTVEEQLGRLGIDALLVARRISETESEVIVHVAREGEARALPGHRFRSQDFVPTDIAELLMGEDLLIHPLDDGGEYYGFAVLPLARLSLHQIELVRELLCVAVRA